MKASSTVCPNPSKASAALGGKCDSHPKVPQHALTGNFRVLSAQGDWLPVVRDSSMQFESQEAFDELRNALRSEHKPCTATEFLLVDRLAEHTWLSERAQKFADLAFLDHDEKMMALMLRFRTTHDRAFHRCLAELRTVRKERRREAEFDSKNRNQAENHDGTQGQSQAQIQTSARLSAESQQFESQTAAKPRWTRQEMLEKARQYADANFERIEREIQADLVRIAREAEAAALNADGSAT